MAPISPTDGVSPLDQAEQATLLNVARRSIEHGLAEGRPFAPSTRDVSPRLRSPGASFVTLHLDNQLRGCIGSLVASRALVTDVAEHAWAAAFEDPRFEPVTGAEAPGLDIHVSVLSDPQPLECENEDQLIERLRPGVDGLILVDGPSRATFLPTVWAELQDPRKFLEHLKRKASLPPRHWSETLRFYRYTTETFPD